MDFDFRDFGTPKTVIYVDSKQKLHFYMDDIFSMYSAHKLSPLILHAIRWHEGREEYMYPENANWTLLCRPEFMRKMAKKFNYKYGLAETVVPAPELLTCLDTMVEAATKLSPQLMRFAKSRPIKISWRSVTKNPKKMGVADTDTFTNRIFLDPIVAQAPPYVRVYVLLHEVALIKYYNDRTYSVNKEKVSNKMARFGISDDATAWIEEHEWRIKDE